MTRRALAAVILALALPLADLAPARAEDDSCARQSRRVRLPSGFAEARVSFVGVLTNGRSRTGESFPGRDLRELRLVVEWTEIEKVHHQRLEISSPDGALYQRFAGTLRRHRPASDGHHSTAGHRQRDHRLRTLRRVVRGGVPRRRRRRGDRAPPLLSDPALSPRPDPAVLVADLAGHFLQRGNTLRLRARGSSMLPFLRDGDVLEIRPAIARRDPNRRCNML